MLGKDQSIFDVYFITLKETIKEVALLSTKKLTMSQTFLLK